MTGYESKRAAARDKLEDDRRAYYEKFDDLYAVYLNGVYDGKKAAAQEPTKYSFKAHWEEDGCIGVVAAIERLDGGVHLLKDTIDAPQEPIGYAVPTFDFDNSVIKKVHYSGTVPLYTAPPQRPWVGLTVEEIEAIGKPYEEKDRSMQAWGLFACAIEARLKEKNT